ncbi:sensor histidine kinase [Pseudoclavibacter chungangensis]|uniref:histidine kinase n=1 Tax=Pseudoclavibacter chungangensis TaxID=587635 RepID=A0A7J5C1R6_9MICO|nr:sensor histidine kinase [Pseudoclavibacter chungangensis]KAB1662564.1 sensor histidine kinase [Pseudoclavibacter chungangensis]NYJ68609.1 signal transduction histidine kinase [Pseudoclavibacter chungangensis]
MSTNETRPQRRRDAFWNRLTGVGDGVPDDWVRPREWRRHLPFDLLIAALLTSGMVVSAYTYDLLYVALDSGRDASPLWASIVVPLLFFAGLAGRHAAPILSMVLGSTAFTIGQLALYNDNLFTQVACFFLIYSAGAWSAHRVAVTVIRLIALVAGTVWALGSYSYSFSSFPAADPNADLTPLIVSFTFFTGIINVLYFGAALLFGSNDYRRAGREEVLRRQSIALTEQANALLEERRTVAQQAVQLDRVAIARELHDVVAHYVSLMGLQAAAARRSLAKSPDRAERALLEVESSARTAIAELQAMLSTLRDDERDAGGSATDAPSTRTMDRIPELVEELRSAGMVVNAEVVGRAGEVTPVVGTAAYRIVQEALTNARKHAGAATLIDVRLRYLSTSVEVEITDTGASGGSAPQSVGTGRGITGMRERVLAVGGVIEVGPRAEGGFRVRARLPLVTAVGATGTAPGAGGTAKVVDGPTERAAGSVDAGDDASSEPRATDDVQVTHGVHATEADPSSTGT